MPSGDTHRPRRPALHQALALFGALAAALLAGGPAAAANETPVVFRERLAAFAALGDRSTGSAGQAAAAELITAALSRMGIGEVASHLFAVPVLRHGASTLDVPERRLSLPLHLSLIHI